MSSLLFSPIELRGLSLANRIVVAPMCQYSADNGAMTDWHLVHLGQFAMAGAGVLFCEATAVSPDGRISDRCPGLWDDRTEASVRRVAAFFEQWGNVPFGIQLAHAGRKGSTGAPWSGTPVLKAEDGGWPVIAPSPVPFAEYSRTPQELDAEGLVRLREAFTDAARRADRLGAHIVELHAAHGYLLQQFLSPVSNKRTDRYGGSLTNRIRFPLEVFAAVREVWPADKPWGVRISAVDWIEGGWQIADSLVLAMELERLGCDFLDVSSGGASPQARVEAGPGYQVPFAAAIKSRLSTMKVIAVGQITQAQQAETILRSGQADMVALARGMLYDPRWVWHAAQELGDNPVYPPQYARCHPDLQKLAIPPGVPREKAASC